MSSKSGQHAIVTLLSSSIVTCFQLIMICRTCGVTVAGLQAYIGKYHRHLLLARNGMACDCGLPETALSGTGGTAQERGAAVIGLTGQ